MLFFAALVACGDDSMGGADSAVDVARDTASDTAADTPLDMIADGIFDVAEDTPDDVPLDASPELDERHAENAAEFVKDAINWMTTFEDEDDTIEVSGSAGSGAIAIRNGMRNAIRWSTSDTRHELGDTTNLGMCMSAHAMAAAYPFVPSQQTIIERHVSYFQRALLVTQERSSGHIAAGAFPAKPGADQYSAKTNAICGRAFVALYTFWDSLGDEDQRDEAKDAALDAMGFLRRLQTPSSLPGMPTALSFMALPDANDDGVFDGIFEEVAGGALVPSAATWGAIAAGFYADLAETGWSEVPEDLRERAEAMCAFAADGLAAGAEHYSPRFECSASACAPMLAGFGSSIAVVSDYSESASRVSGGDDRWHARRPRRSGDTVLFANLNGSDPVQWALNAMARVDASRREASHFEDYFSMDALQLHRTDRYQLIDDKRDIFLGLGTYIAHGLVRDGVFELDDDGGTVAHYVRKDDEWQIVTSNYGDNAVATWAYDDWMRANRHLLETTPLREASSLVAQPGSYDFGELSHLAHWAMTLDDESHLHPKLTTDGRMTVSSENMASTLCRVIRAWQGPDACTL